MDIRGVQKITLIDYPGKVASTIFTFGCNLSCGYCHNPDLVAATVRTPGRISEEDAMKILAERKDFIDGACITGGEPTLQDDLPEFAAKVKTLGLLVKLDTNGTNPGMLNELLEKGLVDYIAMDIKVPLEKYGEWFPDTGKIEKSVDIVKKFPDYEFRTTVLPKLHSADDIVSISRWLGGSKRYFLQQFRPADTLDKAFNNERAYTPEQLKDLARLAKPFFDVCEVRNLS